MKYCFILLLSFPLFGFGQSKCDCVQTVDSVIVHIERNYPFFIFHSTLDSNYIQQKRIVRENSLKSTSSKNCHQIIQNFLSWFGDGHIGISYSGDVFKPKIIKDQNTQIWENLTEDAAKRHCDSVGSSDPLTGIWESYESFYKVLIAKTKIGYSAFILNTINKNWKKGEVKMEFIPSKAGKLVCTFYTSDHSIENPEFVLSGNILEINKITVWNRLYPRNGGEKSVESYVSARYKWTQEFRNWSKDVFYIQLQNLNAGVKPLIDSLIKENKVKIESAKTLIIDLRDNEGGDLTVFESLYPFILERPAIQFGTNYYCTPSNLKNYQKQLNELEGEIDSEFQMFAKEMQRFQGQIWKVSNDTLYPVPGFKKPEKVILLVNEKCKSSTEDFILTIKSGSNAIIAGTKTGGVADFEEVIEIPLPCEALILFHPIGFSNRLPSFPIDGIGIKPDIKLKSRSKAWQPWVREVLNAVK